MVVSSAVMKCPRPMSNNYKVSCNDKIQSVSHAEVAAHVNLSTRRDVLKGLSLATILTLSCGIRAPLVCAEEVSEDDEAYLKSAREVVKTLKESLEEDPKDSAKFRRVADSAKEAIREYLGSWRGQRSVSAEESYVELEKAIRALAGFYSKAGPSAAIGAKVKSEILKHLNTADEFLHDQQEYLVKGGDAKMVIACKGLFC